VTPGEAVPRILVAGIGNILLQDDGFGPQAVARLEAEYEVGSEVELLDLGTPTLDFVDYLAGREIVILLDALSCGGEPGEVLTFGETELRQHLPGMRLSAHQPCLAETLFAAETAGINFTDIRLIGVVGRDFEVGTELSRDLEQAMPRALSLLCEILQQHGVAIRRRQTAIYQKTWWSRERSATALSNQ
jgi:hydrogenase maturation protease